MPEAQAADGCLTAMNRCRYTLCTYSYLIHGSLMKDTCTKWRQNGKSLHNSRFRVRERKKKKSKKRALLINDVTRTINTSKFVSPFPIILLSTCYVPSSHQKPTNQHRKEQHPKRYNIPPKICPQIVDEEYLPWHRVHRYSDPMHTPRFHILGDDEQGLPTLVVMVFVTLRQPLDGKVPSMGELRRDEDFCFAGEERVMER